MLASMWQSSYFKLSLKETFWTGFSFHCLQPLLYLKVHLFQEAHTGGRHQRAVKELSTGQVWFCFLLQIKMPLSGSTGLRTAVWRLEAGVRARRREAPCQGQDQSQGRLPGQRLPREKQFLASILSLRTIVWPQRYHGGLGMGLELGQAGEK